MTRGYIEWVHNDNGNYISFITNRFNRVLYINKNFPDGSYEKMNGKLKMNKSIKGKCTKGREFSKEDLMIELL